MHTKENNSMDDGMIRVDVDKAWSKLKGRLQSDGLMPEHSPSRTMSLMPVFRVAAAVVLVVGLALVSYLVFSPSENDMRLSFQSDRFESTRLSLPDGSSVDLNSNSKIQFRENESGFRSVKLSGEAYFDVSHDPEKPFIINVGQAVIRVTGTAFSVRSFPSGRRIEVYVESGSVQFYQAGKEEDKIALEPGNMGVLEENKLRKENNPDENYLSWKTGKLTFRQTDLGEVARVLNRTYTTELLFSNNELENCLFTGTFDQQPMDSVVRVIQLAFNLDLDQNKNSYVLSGEACN